MGYSVKYCLKELNQSCISTTKLQKSQAIQILMISDKSMYMYDKHKTGDNTVIIMFPFQLYFPFMCVFRSTLMNGVCSGCHPQKCCPALLRREGLVDLRFLIRLEQLASNSNRFPGLPYQSWYYKHALRFSCGIKMFMKQALYD